MAIFAWKKCNMLKWIKNWFLVFEIWSFKILKNGQQFFCPFWKVLNVLKRIYYERRGVITWLLIGTANRTADRNIFYLYKSRFREKMLGFFLHFLFILLSKLNEFMNSDDCIGKNHIEIYQTIASFYWKKKCNSLKNGLFIPKKGEIQAIIYIYIYN